jgi:hypothetical protein
MALAQNGVVLHRLARCHFSEVRGQGLEPGGQRPGVSGKGLGIQTRRVATKTRNEPQSGGVYRRYSSYL